MEIALQKEFLKSWVLSVHSEGKTIGFVPTMGALHDGHLDLVRKAKTECDVVVVSIFVNPLQFNNAGDLEKYPRPISEDQKLLAAEGVDLLYSPTANDFYSSPSRLTLDFGSVASGLEGAMRPGHFSGVGIVVARLFHLVSPDKAYFGAKDLQQVAVIRALVRDLDFNVEIIRCPTRREENGLAMSSRNLRLSAEGREIASHLFKALKLASGLEDPFGGKEKALHYLSQFSAIEVEYLEWVDAGTMEIWNGSSPVPYETAICIAAWIEGVRLIDNIVLQDFV
ncbi:MAG TPA: pantoate--beta-alanine ligase [Catalimonadaceae bacterium]|nr:pantoate--beta-alanine ligase [Catalimonadaceae bacterium]